MSDKKSEILSSQCLARSPRGLWIKGIRTETSVDLFWKVRFHYENGYVSSFDYNGDLISKTAAADEKWGAEWQPVGSIELVDEMVLTCGLENFDEFVAALMRHAVYLMVLGYGDDLTEVVDWFFDFDRRMFVVDGRYKIVGEHGEFRDLVGEAVDVKRDDDRFYGVMRVAGQDFEFDLTDNSVFSSFIIATNPIDGL